MARTFVRCKTLFIGLDDAALQNHSLVIRDGMVEAVLPHADAPAPASEDTVLRSAHEAGVPFMTGSDSGFAVTPYGEWHAREIEILVDWRGFTPAQALRAATSVSARLMPRGHDPNKVPDFNTVKWYDLYTRERVAQLQSRG